MAGGVGLRAWGQPACGGEVPRHSHTQDPQGAIAGGNCRYEVTRVPLSLGANQRVAQHFPG